MRRGILFIGLIVMIGIIVSFLAGYGVRNYSQSIANLQSATQGLVPFSTAGSSTISSSQASSTALNSFSTSPSQPGFLNVSSTPSSTFEYKILQNVDPCTLNKLGLGGWKLFQIGSIIAVPGYDIDCVTYNVAVSGIDWAVFERP